MFNFSICLYIAKSRVVRRDRDPDIDDEII